jgi:hypothetical protein
MGGFLLAWACDRVVVHVRGHGQRVKKSAWGEAVRLRYSLRFLAVHGRPSLVDEGVHLALAQPYRVGEFADASRLSCFRAVDQPSEQVTGVQSVAVFHGSPFVSAFPDTKSIALSTELVQLSGQGFVHGFGKESAKGAGPGGVGCPGSWTMSVHTMRVA